MVGGRETGYTLAIAITAPENLSNARLVLDLAFGPEETYAIPDAKWDEVKDVFENKEDLLDLWLRTFGTNALRDGAASIVADFDSEFLEPRRASRSLLLCSVRFNAGER